MNVLSVFRLGANVESLFIDILKTAPSTGLILVVLWYGQKAITEKIDSMSRRMDCFEKSQHVCQIDIAKNYVQKSDMAEIEKSVSNHESRISKLEAK